MGEQTMPTLDELREAYDDADRVTLFGESGKFVSEAVADALIAAQQQRIDALTKALEPFAKTWQDYLDRDRVSPTFGRMDFPEWKDRIPALVGDEKAYRDAYAALHADEGDVG